MWGWPSRIRGRTGSASAHIARRYVFALVLLGLTTLVSLAVIESSLAFQQRQVRIASLSAEQSRTFTQIGSAVRGLLQSSGSQDTPEEVREGWRDRILADSSVLKANTREILALDNKPLLGLVRLPVMTPYYRSAPHNLEARIDSYVSSAQMIAWLDTEGLASRNSEWIPSDIALGSGAGIQTSFDRAMAEAYRAASDNVALMQRIERLIVAFMLALMLLEGIVLFAPLVRRLQSEEVQVRTYASQLEGQARRDPLTNLANRKGFNTWLDMAIAMVDDDGPPLALALIDLDKFKPVNDNFGHAAGDALLVEIARRLERFSGPEVLVARLGGDEFALIDAGFEGEPCAFKARLEEILAAIEEPFQFEGWELAPGASLGAAFLPHHADNPKDLVKAADSALCLAKARNLRTHVYDPGMKARDALERLTAVELHRAIAQGEFTAFYQPQVALHSGALFGFEAFVRWRHPDRGMVPAADFIRIAERQGIIPDITASMLETVAGDVAGWLAAGLEPGRISLNMPDELFATEHAEQLICRAFEAHGVPLERIGVEVTERVFLHRAADRIVERLAALSARGIAIAFDDFGTGYASLGLLRDFPCDTLKIDQSFVADLTANADNVAIVRAVIGLARNLGKTVVAEGVETELQRALLLAEGCPQGQGYLFGAPVSAAEARALLVATDEAIAGARTRQQA